jgi:NadR type nicotinamide-nucleotide adenylyltransferase
VSIIASPPPLAWYGSSFAYLDDEPQNDEERDAAAELARAARLAGFSPAQFEPEPGGADTSGVVLGRFLPVHDGHRYLIESARRFAARIHVFVRVGASDPVPFVVRRDWLTELFPDVTVVPVEDLPHGAVPTHRDSIRHWAGQIRAHANPDYLIAGEDHDKYLAQMLGAQYVPVDRHAVRVSGTKVRADPWAWERYLPPPVRAWYVRRVCLIGAESTGKSLLAGRLAEHYGTIHVPEQARRRPVLMAADVTRLAYAQRTAEDLLARRAHRVLFCDTDLLTVRLWSERLYGSAPDWLRAASEEPTAELYLLTEPDLPFNGTALRNTPAERAAFHDRCVAELTRLGRPYVPVRGEHEQRLATAVAAVDALLAQPGR